MQLLHRAVSRSRYITTVVPGSRYPRDTRAAGVLPTSAATTVWAVAASDTGKAETSVPRAQGDSQCHYWCRWDCGWPVPAAPRSLSTWHCPHASGRITRETGLSSAHSLHKFPPWFVPVPSLHQQRCKQKILPSEPLPQSQHALQCVGRTSLIPGWCSSRASLHLTPSPHGRPDYFLDQLSGKRLGKGNASLPPKHWVCLNSSASMGEQPFTFAKILASVSSVVLPDS